MKHRVSIGLALIGLVAGVTFAVIHARGPSVRTTMPTRKDLEQHIVASGRVWVPTRVEVAAQTPGLVVAVAVVEGQHVKAGDLLVQLDDATARASVAQSRAAVDQASARVDQLRRVGAIVATEELRQAQTNLERTQADLDRARKLSGSGAIPQVELDNAIRAVDLARAQKAGAEAQQISSAPLGADSRVALTVLLQAQAQLAGANAALAQTKIVALQDGIVLTRSVEPGNVVQPSRTLLVLAAGSDTQLVFQADERNLAAIDLGQTARASADAYPDQIFDAVVSYVAPSIDPQRGSIEVRLRVANGPKFLKPDMTVSIDLLVAAKQKALVLPSETLHSGALDQPWVFVVQQGHIARKDLKLGLRGEGSVEIASGIDETADVVLSDGQPLVVGERVRASREDP